MKRVLVNIICCLLSASCWGNSILYIAAVSALICFLFIDTHKVSIRISLGVFILLIYFDPSIVCSSSLVGVSLMLCGRRSEAASYLGSQLPLLISPLITIPLFLLHPIGSLFIYGVLIMCCHGLRRYKFPAEGMLTITYACLLISLTFTSWQLSSVESPSIPTGYGIGNTIKKITGKDTPSNGQIVYDNDSYREVVNKGTLYLDHDAKCQWDSGNFSQNRPWGHNLPIGSEIFRKAILQDGTWISNLGASLTCSNSNFIGGLFQDNELIPLIIKHDGELIFGDSDAVIDCLAPYQKHLISYLAGTNNKIRCFHLGCAICLIVVNFWASPIFIILPCLVNFITVYLPYQGDVRYIGKSHKWAHTELGEGIVRVLQQHGVNVVFGNSGTRVLVVGTDYSASLSGEKVVILEPGAEIIIDGVQYCADITPLGQHDGVKDARRIIVDGVISNSSILYKDGVRIIATGTPTAQEKELIWPF